MRALLPILVFSLAAAAVGAGRGVTVTLKESEAQGAPVAGAVELYSESHALVIGIDDYSAGWTRLSNAVADATKVARALGERGFDVTLETDLAGRDLEQSFEDFFIDKGVDPNARLFVWFAGHGHTLADEGYLIPADGVLAIDERNFKRRSLSLRRFGEFVRLANSKHVYTIFDSCFSGTIFNVARAAPPPAITRVTTEPVRQFLSSGDAGQTVSDDGTFAALFVEALAGRQRADLNADGYLTASEFGSFVTTEMSNITSNAQVPRTGKLADPKYRKGDFVFLAALTQPRNLPSLPTDADFNLSDIERQAEAEKAAMQAEEAARQAWEERLAGMRDAFGQVRAVDQNGVAPDTRIAAWQRFLVAFEDDNPYSSADESMRSEGRARIGQLENERDLAARQLASTVPVSAPRERRDGTFKDCAECPEMVVIPAGRFRMGDLNGGGDDDENPVREVTVSTFALGKYEVTFAEYDGYARAAGKSLPEDRGWGRGNRPVIDVSWNDARDYAAWLSQRTGKRYRLPSEAEWEYAARAGTTTKYPWGNDIGRSKANCSSCGSRWDEEQTAPVGSFAANAFGLHDMHGNVWEWVEDCYHDSYRMAPTDGSARTGGSCAIRVLRGGSFYVKPRALRSAYRGRSGPGYRYFSSGFRLAQDL